MQRTETNSLPAFLAMGCVGFIASAQPVLAQEQSGAAQHSEKRLGGVTVTDTELDDALNRSESSNVKFTQPLLDTPRSITVIPRQLIDERAFTTLTDVLRTTPGVTLGNGEGGTPLGDRPFIRGYEASTDIYIDGVRNVGRSTYEVFTLDSVEVVKGPGGAVSGRGSTGGSINMISKLPQEGTSVSINALAGTAGTMRLTSDLNVQVADNIGFRVAAMLHEGGTAGRDTVWNNRYGVMPSLTIGLGQPTRLTLSYYYLTTSGIADQGLPFQNSGTETPVVIDRNLAFVLAERDFSDTENQIATATFEHDFNDRITIRNTTRYTRVTNEAVFSRPSYASLPAAGQAVDDPTRVVRVDFRSHNRLTTGWLNQTDLRGTFETGSIEHSFIGGIEFSKEKIEGRPVLLQAPLPGQSTWAAMRAGAPTPRMAVAPLVRQVPTAPLALTELETKAAFLFDTLTILPQLELNLGLRFDSFKAKNRSVESKSDMFNYTIGAVYKPVPNGSIYLSYSTSSNPSGETEGQSGGADGPSGGGLGGNRADLDPERAKSWELGTKWDLLDGGLSLTAAVFQTRKDNARATDPATGLLALIGKNCVRGFELGATGNITPDWSVFAGYTYLDAELLEDGDGVVPPENSKLKFIAPNSFSLWTNYRFLGAVDLGAGANYVDKRYVNDDNTLHFPSYWRFDASAGYDVSENFRLQLNVQNIGNKTYFDSSHVGIFAVVAPGRSVLASGTFRF